ncbi:MAG: tetratricopeptide repeat protein [Gemmatimonadetes bacterium]|nr:tetratricopeptide repeat protein [Gemmatimonadota bacterium]
MLLAQQVMDTIQEFKSRASTLEAKGDDPGALKVYASIPSDKVDAGVMGRMAAVQVRLGKNDEALRSHERVAAMLLNEGLSNAAIFAYRQLLKAAPDHAEAHLRLGQLTGAAGYTRDSIAAFSGYLSNRVEGDDGSLGDLLAVLEQLPPQVVSDVVAAIRDQVLSRDPSMERRLDDLFDQGSAESAPKGIPNLNDLESSAPADGLEQTAIGGGNSDLVFAPLEGLETNAGAATDIPSILDDLPLLAAALPARGEDDVADEGESDDAPDGDADLPLLGFGVDREAADDESSRTLPSADGDGWVDFGALVLGQDGDESSFDPGERNPISDSSGGEDFTDLLRILGAEITGESEDEGSHYDLGLAYREMGLLAAAVAQLHDALAAGESALASLEVLGECYLDQGDHEKALAVLQRAMGLESAGEMDLLGVRYLQGRCEEAIGEIEAARESYTSVIAIEPRFRDAAVRLERL